MTSARLPIPSRPLFLLLLLALLLWLPILGNHAVWPADEPRFAEVAREMLLSGDYLVPRINFEPYYEKPPLLPWAIVAFSSFTGEVTEITSRLPSMFAGLLCLAATFLLAERLFDRHVAFWSALVLLLCQRFWWQGHTAQIDMLLCGCLSLSFLALWRWNVEPRRCWQWLFFAGITLGVYAKGPPALVFPFLAVFVFFWKDRTKRRQLHPWLGLLAVAAVACLWLVPARMAAGGGLEDASQTLLFSDLFRQIIGRVFLGVSKAQPPWYYLVNLPYDWFPWSLFLPWTAIWAWRRRREPPVRYLLAWSVPAFILFSLFSGKRAIYLLPIYPALAILVAVSLQDLATALHTRWLKVTGGVWSFVLLLFAAAPIVLRFSPYRSHAHLALDLFGLCCLVLAIHTLMQSFGPKITLLPMAIAGHSALLLLLIGTLIFPVLDHYKSAREFCAPVRQLSALNVDFDLISWGQKREEYLFYTRHAQTIILPDPAEILGKGLNPPSENSLQLARSLFDASMRFDHEHAPLFTPGTSAYTPDSRAFLMQALQPTHIMPPASQTLLEEGFGRLADPLLKSRPTLLFLQTPDWWILSSFVPQLKDYVLIQDQQLGRRTMLLLANPAAYKLIQDKDLVRTPTPLASPAAA